MADRRLRRDRDENGNDIKGFSIEEHVQASARWSGDGHDFDALFDDELASCRSKKIMDAFNLDEDAVGNELMTSDLRHMAGFLAQWRREEF